MSDNLKTGMLPEDDPQVKQALARQDPRQLGTATLGGKNEVMLLIGGDVKRFSLKENGRWLLGRFEEDTIRPDQVDLSPYNALTHGVSRFHVELRVEDGHLYALDLNSTNGSYLGSEPLIPNKPTLVHNGDELLLGRLAIQVLFR